MANWLYDDLVTLLSTTKVIDGKVTRWWGTYPFVRVEDTTASTPPATANESSFERTYSGTITLFDQTDAKLETLIELCYTAFSNAAEVYNPSQYYNRTDRRGVKSCQINIAKEEIILPGAI